MKSLVWIILDSCRYDALVRADTPSIARLATLNQTRVERRFSYASWTAPSHYAFLMGLVPHQARRRVFAAETFTSHFKQWSQRLDVPDLDFGRFLPHLSLPRLLNEIGYHTVARVSLPVLNQTTLLSAHFRDYRLMDHHADFPGIIREVEFSSKPAFYFLNLGETHYPYMLSEPDLPRLSGLHGAVRRLADGAPPDGSRAFFDRGMLEKLREQQVRCVEHVDALLSTLFARCPSGTHVIITADHGELFGEDDFFGHGPVIHEKVFEVPFIEGKLP